MILSPMHAQTFRPPNGRWQQYRVRVDHTCVVSRSRSTRGMVPVAATRGPFSWYSPFGNSACGAELLSFFVHRRITYNNNSHASNRSTMIYLFILFMPTSIYMMRNKMQSAQSYTYRVAS